jgi:carbon-monoxide dehydrogenase medium subunit
VYTTSFEYHRAATAEEALRLLARYGEEAKLLAGGHSLVPLMRLRLAQPAHVIDIRQAEGLLGIREEGGQLRIGAAVRYRELETSDLVRRTVPILAEAAATIGDPQVRAMGTIGGSLAHADPAADLPAVVLALDAELVAVGPAGERVIPAEGFFRGLLTTALEPTELLREVRIPLPPPKTGGAYEKQPHPASRFAVVGVAAVVTLGDDGRIARARVALTGVGTHATRATAVEAALVGTDAAGGGVATAAGFAADGLALQAGRRGSVDYQVNRIRVHTRRALERALARARGA